jgi:hypothetical protein
MGVEVGIIDYIYYGFFYWGLDKNMGGWWDGWYRWDGREW